MLDGGCLFKQYSSDITRLWPINGIENLKTIIGNFCFLISGRFSSPHRQLYEILLTVQKDLISYFHSGDQTISREKLNILADQYMIKYLREELILSRTIDDNQAKRIIKFLSPTSVSHHLGMKRISSIDYDIFVYTGLDIHDCESISFSQSLQTGNVITIEPGKSSNKIRFKYNL
jgi:Xaa-Pro aminopeptidase